MCGAAITNTATDQGQLSSRSKRLQKFGRQPMSSRWSFLRTTLALALAISVSRTAGADGKAAYFLDRGRPPDGKTGCTVFGRKASGRFDIPDQRFREVSKSGWIWSVDHGSGAHDPEYASSG